MSFISLDSFIAAFFWAKLDNEKEGNVAWYFYKIIQALPENVRVHVIRIHQYFDFYL